VRAFLRLARLMSPSDPPNFRWPLT
jgi:hypothetical protein